MRRTGELFAAKQIRLVGADGEASQNTRTKQLEEEIQVMRELDHPHIVRYIGTERRKGVFFIFIEYVPGGSLLSMLEQFGPLRETLIRRYTCQIVSGVGYLHSR